MSERESPVADEEPVTYGEFAAALIDRLAASPRIANVVVFESIGSTNRFGRQVQRQALDDELTLGLTAIVGWAQLGGRGRYGRSWDSVAGGGVNATLTPTCNPEEFALLPLLTSVAVAGVIGRYADPPPRLKWPNDVLIGEGKIAGVLIEVQHRAGGSCAASVGFGVNLGEVPPSARRAGAVSLADCCPKPPSLDRLTFELLEAVATDLEELGTAERSDLVARYRALLTHEPGDRLVCRVGSERIEGEYLGVDDGGFLRLRAGDDERVLAAAELEDSSSPRSEGEV